MESIKDTPAVELHSPPQHGGQTQTFASRWPSITWRIATNEMSINKITDPATAGDTPAVELHSPPQHGGQTQSFCFPMAIHHVEDCSNEMSINKITDPATAGGRDPAPSPN
ncbi:hypothetical protein CDAR_120441 [Caerostris darwini]|uniref:Uncharacterized protein n=1 Tax=Caerostris darwini TaxID=1538125 RepID=A0AAV4W386_9ARAC|nr:hypothetical protein CDAR_120441 [Caerostris darwini]